MSKSPLTIESPVEITVKRSGQLGKKEEKTMLIGATLGGTLSTENIDNLKTWARQLNAAIETTSKNADGKSVCTIIDISDFKNYTDPQVLTVLAQLMKMDNKFVYRTATFGGRMTQVMIENIIKTFAGRTNLRNFQTRDEAMAWLSE
jgi:hypothetical protein